MRIVSRGPLGFSKFNILASAAMAVMLAACSSSVTRFADNPSNSDPVYTASVPKPKKTTSYENTDDDAIVSRPLANASVNPPQYSNNTYKYGKAYKRPTYKQPVYQAEAPVDEQPTYTKPAYATTAMKKGGTVRVEQGMTLYSIAKANNITVSQLAAANHISAPYSVSTGRVLRIPGVAQAKAPASRYVAEQDVSSNEDNSTPVRKLSAGGAHTVASGETLFSLGRKYGVSPYTIADLNGLPHDKPLSIGQSVRIPAGKGPALAAKKPLVEEQEAIASNDEQPEVIETPKNLAAKKSLAAEEIPEAAPAPKQVAEATANPTAGGMRWPVKGKIISQYGAKPNGLKNEGINIAVPEGTGIRAAESGVVAYAGNELKGYGNLVLIRHEGGWVTAYAHAKELFVKRGDTVKRGDVIAKAGQTGSVSSPQLHFEVRKGATAMDPLKFLASTTASN
jgi:murein DD-endopeptidase MepM/ murein hydrolase activator NlpD